MTTAADQVAENPGGIGQVKVLVNDYAGHPFQIELSNELARRCHSVTHAFCETNITPRGVLAQSDGGPSVVGISTGQGFAKYNIFRRLGAELRYGMKSAWLMRNARPDVCDHHGGGMDDAGSQRVMAPRLPGWSGSAVDR